MTSCLNLATEIAPLLEHLESLLYSTDLMQLSKDLHHGLDKVFDLLKRGSADSRSGEAQAKVSPLKRLVITSPLAIS